MWCFSLQKCIFLHNFGTGQKPETQKGKTRSPNPTLEKWHKPDPSSNLTVQTLADPDYLKNPYKNYCNDLTREETERHQSKWPFWCFLFSWVLCRSFHYKMDIGQFNDKWMWNTLAPIFCDFMWIHFELISSIHFKSWIHFDFELFLVKICFVDVKWRCDCNSVSEKIKIHVVF